MMITERHDVSEIADSLHGHVYPDPRCVATAYLLRMARRPTVPDYGDGPHHRLLASLGLVVIGRTTSAAAVCQIELTGLGIEVAERIASMRARSSTRRRTAELVAR